jgi:hypothetical protein
MTYSDIISWYDSKYGVKWESFKNVGEAIDYMESNASGKKSDGLRKAINSSKFQNSQEFYEKIESPISEVNSKFESFKSDISEAESLEDLNSVGVIKYREAELEKLKEKRKKELKSLISTQENNFNDIMADINKIGKFTEEELEYRPVLKEQFESEIEAIRFEIETSNLSREQQQTLNNELDKRK